MKRAHTAFSLCQSAKTITQIRPDDSTKDKRKALKGSNFSTYLQYPCISYVNGNFISTKLCFDLNF